MGNAQAYESTCCVTETLAPLRVFVGSWNVGNHEPDAKQLEAWIPKTGYDLYFIGGQEATYGRNKQELNSDDEDDAKDGEDHKDRKSRRSRSKSPTPRAREGSPAIDPDDPFSDILETHLSESAGFSCIGFKGMGQVRGSLFIRTELRHHVTNVHTASEATGFAHTIANKGGVAISMIYAGTRLCFITAHLAAHQTQSHVERRNSDYKEIMTGCSTKLEKRNPRFGMDLELQHHVTFFCGDLNYRVSIEGEHKKCPLPIHQEMVQKITEDKHLDLLPQDQLRREVKSGNIFTNFQEHDITFRPTFKVFPDHKMPEEQKLVAPNLAYMPLRSPAWCDRIYWRDTTDAVVCSEYTSVESLTTSDHKPIRGSFVVPLRQRPHDKVLEGAGKVKFVLTDVKGHDLPIGDIKSSDPEIKFFATFLDGKKKSKHKSSTLNPEWKDSDIPDLKSTINNPAWLSKSFLYMKVNDWDRLSASDNLSQGILPLKEAVESPGVACPFHIQLTKHGVFAGSLEGKITMERKGATLSASQLSAALRWRPEDDAVTDSEWASALHNLFVHFAGSDAKMSKDEVKGCFKLFSTEKKHIKEQVHALFHGKGRNYKMDEDTFKKTFTEALGAPPHRSIVNTINKAMSRR